MDDPYNTLGIARTASREEIKKAYRSLARELHPDRNPDDERAEDQFKKVAYAYEILNDGDKRKLYDEFGEIGLKEGFDPDQYRQYQSWQRRGGGFSGYEDVMRGQGGSFSFDVGDLFGGNLEDLMGHRRRRTARGADLSATLKLDFIEALRGGERELTFGGGKQLKVRFPKGARDGDVLKLKGQGQAAPHGRGPAGDLRLTLAVGGHPLLRREADDLHMDLPVTLVEAYRGAKVRVPLLDGEVTVTIPAGTQPDATLRLRGKGAERGGKRGDFYLHIQPQLPPAGNAETEEALEGLGGPSGDELRGEIKL